MAILVGEVVVPLDVRLHFTDVESRLPEPGHLPLEEPHARKHGGRRYCYSYATPLGPARLELNDSDFGLWNARMLRVDAESSACPSLPATPEFLVGAARFSLAGSVMNAPSGFQSEETDGTLTFSRDWTYLDSDEGPTSGTCFWRDVSVTVERNGPRVRSIHVYNWEEPGC